MSWWSKELQCPGGWVKELQLPGRSRSFSVLVAGCRSCIVLVDLKAAMSLLVGPGAAVS